MGDSNKGIDWADFLGALSDAIDRQQAMASPR
jgi:hypothetical protein